MTQFIFYTDEGYCESPTNQEVNNLQVLGIESGKTYEDVRTRLFENNPWIAEQGFSKESIRQYAMFSTDIVKDLDTVVDYLWQDKKHHNLENNYPKDHIFRNIKRIKKELKK